MTRYSFPRVNSIATYFTQQNCGKRNISLDLRQPRAVEILRELARRSHVVLENFRPGVMDRMGLGYEALAAEHPDLVYASLTGYGSTGPWAHRRAYAPVVGAESGLTWLQGEARGGSYANDPISHGDVYPALECLAGILAALYQRERTGRGQHVEVSMTATLLSINEHVHWELADTPADGFVASFQPGDYPVFTVGDGQTRRRLRPPGRPGHLRALRPRRRPPGAHRRRALRRRRVPAAAAGRAPRRAPGRRQDVPVAGRARGVVGRGGPGHGRAADGPRGGRQRVGPRARRHRRRARPRGRPRAHPQLALALQPGRRRGPGPAGLPRRAQPRGAAAPSAS